MYVSVTGYFTIGTCKITLPPFLSPFVPPLSLLCPSFSSSLPPHHPLSSQSVEMISAEVQILDAPNFHRLTASQSRTGGAEVIVAGNDVGQAWAVEWRRSVRMQEGRAVPLPLPPDKRRFASMRELLKASTRPLGALHRYIKGGEGGKTNGWGGRGGERRGREDQQVGRAGRGESNPMS